MAYDSLGSKYAYLTRIQLVERLDEIIDELDQVPEILFIKGREFMHYEVRGLMYTPTSSHDHSFRVCQREMGVASLEGYELDQHGGGKHLYIHTLSAVNF